MRKEYLIKKWLDNELTEKEKTEFSLLDDSNLFENISNTIKNIETPNYDSDKEYSKVKDYLDLRLKERKVKKKNYFILKIAAVFVLSFGLLLSIYSKKTYITSSIGEKTNFVLPDNSKVAINSASSVNYKRLSWDYNRILNLDGEAYFEVEKGEKFVVKTKQGNIQVLGTKFKVNSRNNLFEVTCYEGKVAVNYNDTYKELSAGDKIIVVDNNIQFISNIEVTKPFWLDNKSVFKSIPIELVLNEFERQYNVKVKTNFNTKELFTGSFNHDDLNQALKSITLPLNLSVKKNKDVITLAKK
jgi:ferric-dicitrate binding protein FerR (iron transport regulator)